MAEKIATREAFGKAIAALSAEHPELIVLDADLAGATNPANSKRPAPNIFLDMGIAEADMVGVAAGLAACGKKPFCCSFAMFTAGRAYEQVAELRSLSPSECEGGRLSAADSAWARTARPTSAWRTWL